MSDNLSDAYCLPDKGFLRQSELIPEILPFSAATLWRKVKSGEFPKPIRLSKRITAWRVEDIRIWLDNLINKGK